MKKKKEIKKIEYPDGDEGISFNIQNKNDYNLLSSKENFGKVVEIDIFTKEALSSIENINNTLGKFSELNIIIPPWTGINDNQEKILALFNYKNFNAYCLPNIYIHEYHIRTRSDVTAITLFLKFFISNIYRSFTLSDYENFDDKYEDFSIYYFDFSIKDSSTIFKFGESVYFSKNDINKMHKLSSEDHFKLCSEALKKFNPHDWLKLDTVYNFCTSIKLSK